MTVSREVFDQHRFFYVVDQDGFDAEGCQHPGDGGGSLWLGEVAAEDFDVAGGEVAAQAHALARTVGAGGEVGEA